jgi:hypothetical protein
MGQPATAKSPTRPVNPQKCGKDAQKIINVWRPQFTPKNMKGQPSVRVSQVPVTGNTAKVPARDIYVNGQSLHTILVSNSHGLQPNQVHAIVDAAHVQNRWYITGLDM